LIAGRPSAIAPARHASRTRRQAIKDQKNCGIPGDSETEPPHFECDHRHRREFSF
jgi:hypothetical protein